jgi:hypothetical protein
MVGEEPVFVIQNWTLIVFWVAIPEVVWEGGCLEALYPLLFENMCGLAMIFALAFQDA